jgi:quinol monooxygenase YgiN
MYARLWQLRIKPGKLDEFRESLSSLVQLARRQSGYRGVLVLGTGRHEAPDLTVVAVWDSLEQLRASETNLFLMQAISRYMSCCESMPHVSEQELLATDFIATGVEAGV